MGHDYVSVLMSPGMSARFEVLDITDHELQAFEDNPPAVDLDAWHTN